MSVHVMKRGATTPSLRVTITAYDDDAGVVQPVDFTEATEVLAHGYQNGVLIINRDVTAGAGADGVVEMDWVAGDTDAIGYIRFEFPTTWADGTEQTFPEDGTVRARITLEGS